MPFGSLEFKKFVNGEAECPEDSKNSSKKRCDLIAAFPNLINYAID